MVRLALICTGISLAVMILIDRAIGPKAEFLNAWSMIERLLGREPTAGVSMVARHLGAAGEFIAVLLANALIGAFIAGLVRHGSKLLP